MTSRFSISPATSPHPASVTLVMPHGYTATAFVTDPCGHPIPGASVTVSGETASPHIPAAWKGTAYVDWRVSKAGPAPASGGKVSLVLASKQTVGTATSCTTGQSPYGSAQVAVPAAGHGPTGADDVLGGVFLAAVAAGAVVAVQWRRRHRVRGGHAR